jgi:hypothetical protein
MSFAPAPSRSKRSSSSAWLASMADASEVLTPTLNKHKQWWPPPRGMFRQLKTNPNPPSLILLWVTLNNWNAKTF